MNLTLTHLENKISNQVYSIFLSHLKKKVKVDLENENKLLLLAHIHVCAPNILSNFCNLSSTTKRLFNFFKGISCNKAERIYFIECSYRTEKIN